MRKSVVVVVGLVAGALLVPAAPASAHVMTCAKYRADAEGRAGRFLHHLRRQYLKSIEQFDQVGEGDTLTGVLSPCPSSDATRARHRHELKYTYTVSQTGPGGNYVNAKTEYTVRLRLISIGKKKRERLESVVLRPGGKVAVGGEQEPAPVLPDPEPLNDLPGR